MDYLAIIRKADFVDLFKYGKLNVYNAVDFDGNVGTLANDDDLLGQLTKHMNLFEYSFEYLILHFTCANANNDFPLCLRIEDVLGLYTFDDDAKIEMSISFDHRIKLQVSPWSEKIKNWHLEQQISQSKRGVNNLWKILDLSDEDRSKCEACEKIITDDIVREVFKELFSNERPKGEQSIWTYLLRYERHSFYPRDIRGYLCDYIHVVCNWMNKEELQGDVAETTKIYPEIMSCPGDTSFQTLLEMVNASPLPSHTDEHAGCKFAIAAFLFLFMKNKFKDEFVTEEAKRIFDKAKKYGLECSVAVYLLGLTLGYDKTYDAYYDSIKLRIFKTENQEANKLDCVQESNEKEIHLENRNENVAEDTSSKSTVNDKDISPDTNSPTKEQKNPSVQQGQLFMDSK